MSTPYAHNAEIHSIIIHNQSINGVAWDNYVVGPNAMLPPEDPMYDPADMTLEHWYLSPAFVTADAVEAVLFSSDNTGNQPYFKLWGTDTAVGTIVNPYTLDQNAETDWVLDVQNSNGFMLVDLYADGVLILTSGELTIPYYDTGVVTHTYRATHGSPDAEQKVTDASIVTGVVTTSVATSDLMDVFLSDNVDGSFVRQLLNEDMIDTSILTAMDAGQTIFKAADMDARDLIEPTQYKNVLVLVLDPRTGVNADATVSTGAAMYVGEYQGVDLNPQTFEETVNIDWTKVYEAESLDLVFDYTDILNTPVLPNSTASEIDQLVTNMATLQTNVANLFSAIEDANGDIVYNGSTLSNAGNVSLATVNW